MVLKCHFGSLGLFTSGRQSSEQEFFLVVLKCLFGSLGFSTSGRVPNWNFFRWCSNVIILGLCVCACVQLKQNPGQLRINPVGFYWRKIGGGKEVEVPKNEISSLSWTRVPKGYQLGVKLKAGQDVKFNGFREQVAMIINILLFLLH